MSCALRTESKEIQQDSSAEDGKPLQDPQPPRNQVSHSDQSGMRQEPMSESGHNSLKDEDSK